MASAKKGKVLMKQEDLRRLMREKQRAGDRQKRIESPFARYSSAGTLTCELCDISLKSALLWQTHTLGKHHRGKLAELKGGKPKKEVQELELKRGAPGLPSSSSVLKRAAEPERTSGKPAKPHNASGACEDQRSTAGQALVLLAGHYEDDEDEGSDSSKTPVTGATLPLDFFDSDFSSSVVEADIQGTKKSTRTSSEPPRCASEPPLPEDLPQESHERQAEAQLPEGFFQDPERDARERGAELPGAAQEREWMLFRKEIRQLSEASEALELEMDEERRVERQILETEQQIHCLQRVQQLRERGEDRRRRRKAEMRSSKMRDGEGVRSWGGRDEDHNEKEDEEELMHVLTQDWRSKGVLA
ncbi:hypothetical protein DNTS_004866 [Danionella cerebrum]|uniref:Zinc finger protein 830 n=1 Tax=Danionella cerebrum TaxID=2873325 RepID=A0A553NGP5_9TELE|nr:hypothetical protein DNTS_004866 [Danionella translucida]